MLADNAIIELQDSITNLMLVADSFEAGESLELAELFKRLQIVNNQAKKLKKWAKRQTEEVYD